MEINSAAMDINSDQISNPKFSINVLQKLKSSHLQHGLRFRESRDYTRYRKYCTARLRRLYKSLKCTHGRGKYAERATTVASITDVRYLLLVLYTAERAWGHAMERRQLEKDPNARQRSYIIGRLRKAVKWATHFAELCAVKGNFRTSLEAEAYASYMRGNLLSEQDQDWNISLKCFKNARAVYEELGKYGDLRNQALCHEYIEDLESSIRICQNKIGASDLQTSELMQTGEMEEPALRLFRAKLEAVMAEECSQQAASMKEFHWLGHRFPIHNANISASILKAEELEKEVNEPTSSDISTEKKLVMFDKIFAAYHEAMSCICKDLNTAGDSEDTRDDLSGLGRAIGAVLGKRTIERNQLLVAIAKSKHQSEPEELVRLYDLLLQNATDLSDLVSSRRDIKPEELTLTEECAFKSLVFRAERCFYLAKSYSLAGKRTEAYALFCRAGSLASCVLKKGQSQSFANEVMMKELKLLYDNSRSNCCIEHATGIVEDEKAPAHLSDKLSSMSLTGVDKKMEKYLMENLDSYESAVADSNIRTLACIQPFPPEHQAIPCNPIVLDLVYNSIHFPSLENRMKKDKKGFITWLWR